MVAANSRALGFWWAEFCRFCYLQAISAFKLQRIKAIHDYGMSMLVFLVVRELFLK